MPKKLIFNKIAITFAICALVVANLAFLPRVFASNTTHASVILTNMNASGSSAVIVAFTPANTGTSLTLTMGGGTVASSQTYATTLGGIDCETLTGATAHIPGSPAATGSSGTITFSGITAYTSGTSYCGILTGSAVTNPSAGVEAATLTAGSDAADALQVDIISNDQVVVSATVPASYTLALSGNTDSLGTLASGSVSTSTGVTATVNTNAKNGWFLYGLDSNGGLISASQSKTITSTSVGTNATLSAGTEGYLSGLPAGGITQGSGAGTTSATTAYASSGTGNGAGLSTAEHTLASSTGTANGAIVTVKEFAAISAITPAASDYSDTITLVGAGSF